MEPPSAPRSRRRLVAVAVAIVPTGLTLVRAPGTLAQDSGHDRAEPTVVFVHGAWADASSWSGVVERLHNGGYTLA
jgi:hypothetical protein